MTLGQDHTQTGFNEVFLPKERWVDYACFKSLLNSYKQSPYYKDFNPIKLGRFLSNIILIEPLINGDQTLDDFRFLLQGENTKPLYGNIVKTTGQQLEQHIFKRTLIVLNKLMIDKKPLMTQIERISIDKFYYKVEVLYVPFLDSEQQISKIICQLNIKMHEL